MPKPQTAAGYTPDELAQVESLCLTIATILGDLMDDLVIVGGLTPVLLIDRRRGQDFEEGISPMDDAHPGTNDLDVGLAVTLLDENRYKEISERLRARGFEPDTNDAGQATNQRWRLGDLKVTVDFLIGPVSDEDKGGHIRNLEVDFAALVAPGLELAFVDRERVEIDGTTIFGDRAVRQCFVVGPAAFILLKAFAFRIRGEAKDAYDLCYVLRHWPGGVDEVVSRLADLSDSDQETVAEALRLLGEDFSTSDHIGPRSVARFLGDEGDDALQADVHGSVADLLERCRSADLIPAE